MRLEGHIWTWLKSRGHQIKRGRMHQHLDLLPLNFIFGRILRVPNSILEQPQPLLAPHISPYKGCWRITQPQLCHRPRHRTQHLQQPWPRPPVGPHPSAIQAATPPRNLSFHTGNHRSMSLALGLVAKKRMIPTIGMTVRKMTYKSNYYIMYLICVYIYI